jgi:indolepyruvate ferredoxin oxidoreductase, beta subunit
MRETTSLLLAGVGGQGTLLVERVVAAAAMASGLQVKTSEVHGMAQRGGSVLAQVRYGERVLSPVVGSQGADIVLAFERIEAFRYIRQLSPRARVFASTEEIVPVTVSSGKAEYPADAEARVERAVASGLCAGFRFIDAVAIAEGLGNRRAGNIVLLGTASESLGLDPALLLDAIRRLAPPKHAELNVKAFEAGRQQA